jgi:hypothetical protein
LRLGALGRAFSARSEQARLGHEAHQVATAALGLADALSTVRVCPVQAAVKCRNL